MVRDGGLFSAICERFLIVEAEKSGEFPFVRKIPEMRGKHHAAPLAKFVGNGAAREIAGDGRGGRRRHPPLFRKK